MIYAYTEGNDKLVVAAATSLAEYDDFYSRAAIDKDAYVEESQPDFMAMLTDPQFSRMKKPPYVFTHLSPTQREEFANRYKIVVLGPNSVIDKSQDMVERALSDMESAFGEADRRTIGEVTGLDKDDPWDKRSEEDKAAEAEAKEAYKKAYDEAMKKGALSGDSFAKPKGTTAQVTDIRTSVNADGTINIDNVRAVKGLHDTQSGVDRDLAEERARVRKDAERNFGDYLHLDGEQPISKRPADYCFAVEGALVAITPRRSFDIDPAVEDRSLTEALKGKLPPSLTEIEPGIFRHDQDAEAVRVSLEALGYRANEALDTLMKGAGPVEGDAGEQDEARRALEAAEQAVEQAREAATAARLKKKPSGSAPGGVISEDHAEQQKPLGPPDHRDANGDNIAIANDGMISVYFKVEVTDGTKIAQVLALLESKEFPLRAIFESRDHAAGCWLAGVREASMSDALEVLEGCGIAAKLYGCDENGEALAPENIEVVDTGATAEIPIRPWNERRKKWDTLTDEEKAENRKEWKGGEFMVTLDYDKLKGCDVMITPRSYFYEHREPFPEVDLVDIAHLLPVDLKRRTDDPFWWRTTSRDDNKLMHDLCVKRGFVDDWELRLWLNQNGY